MSGLIFVNTIPHGTKPHDIIINHNVDGLGGLFVHQPFSPGPLYIDFSRKKPADSYYFYKDILFGDKQLRGDVNELPTNVWGESTILPKMIISPYDEIPEENRGARAVYFNNQRIDDSNFLDMLSFAQNWLSNSCGPTNYWCDGADWNTDGNVDLTDFAMMAGNYLPESD